MGRKNSDKPRGRMSSYAFFVQTCREEHKKKHPGESVVFVEFTKKCAEKWKQMTAKDKRRFEEMAERDKQRYEKEMAGYNPPPGEKPYKRKRTKDPNAPKRSLSAFFFFCADERPSVRATSTTNMSVAEVAKELGKRWETVHDRSKFEQSAAKDKERYEKEMAIYKGKKPKPTPTPTPPPPAPPKKVEEEEEEDEEEDDDDEEEEEDDE